MIRNLFKFDLYRSLLIIADIVSVIGAIFLASSLVFDGSISIDFQHQLHFIAYMSLFVTLTVFSFLGFYSRRIPQLTERDLSYIIFGSLISVILNFTFQNIADSKYWPYWIAFWFFAFLIRSGIGIYASYREAFFPTWQIYMVPTIISLFGIGILRSQNLSFSTPSDDLPISRTIHLLYLFISTSGFVLIRWVFQVLFRLYNMPNYATQKALLIGADFEYSFTTQLDEKKHRYKLVAILDNDPLKYGLRIFDARVVGRVSMIKEAIEQYEIDTVLIVKSSIKAEELNQVELICREAGLKISFLAKISESLLLTDPFSTADLLERSEYRFLPKEEENYIRSKIVLVTGAGGSIGSELVRQIIRCKPNQIIILGRGENSIYELQNELFENSQTINTHAVIVNIADKDALKRVFNEYKPDVVFHTAAHKHVPLMEYNVHEAFWNNVIGTWNVMEQSGIHQVSQVVMVSTDKAVKPSSVMGATKFFAEKVVYEMSNQFENTNYRIVRFGNVLGSRGSVVSLFTNQIRRGGPITITDPRMTRFFMTIPEAVSLVLATGTIKDTFGIYVLDMGKPYRILDLAKKMIRLYGLEVDRDIKIEVTGIRPGEKIDEVLFNDDEELLNTSVKSVKKLKWSKPPERIMHSELLEMMRLNADELKNLILT